MVVGLTIVFIFLMILIFTLNVTAKIIAMRTPPKVVEPYDEETAKREAIKLAVLTYMKERR